MTTETEKETQSRNAPHIYYRAQRRAPRKGAHEVLVGHEWRCKECNAIVHEEPLTGIEEETPEQVSARHLRVKQACDAHTPCPRRVTEDSVLVYTSEAEEDDEARLAAEEMREEAAMMAEEWENDGICHAYAETEIGPPGCPQPKGHGGNHGDAR